MKFLPPYLGVAFSPTLPVGHQVASVGQGEVTPPWTGLFRFSRRGRAPSRPVGKGPFPAPISVVPEGSRPVNDSCEGPGSGRHTGRPLQILLQRPSTPEDRAGTPRPCANTGSLPQKRPPQKNGRRASALLPVCACRDLVSYRLLASSTTLWMASAASAGSLLKPPSAVSRPST